MSFSFLFTVSLPLFLSCSLLRKSMGMEVTKLVLLDIPYLIQKFQFFGGFFFQAQVHYFLLSAGREVCECDGVRARVCVGGGGVGLDE